MESGILFVDMSGEVLDGEGFVEVGAFSGIPDFSGFSGMYVKGGVGNL